MRRGWGSDPFATNTVSIHASVKDATNGSEVYAYGIESFNPRICKRCDIMFFILKLFFFVSIHASVKDATPCL